MPQVYILPSLYCLDAALGKNTCCCAGTTALSAAIKQRRSASVQTLLCRGANLMHVNAYGVTPLAVAQVVTTHSILKLAPCHSKLVLMHHDTCSAYITATVIYAASCTCNAA